MTIHARQRADGTFMYRIWSPICDGYRTDELDEEQLLLQLKYDAAY